jgi:hypothetical protein
MKRLMMMAFLGLMLGTMAGCHVGECWRWAWNSRFHPERNVQAAPCVVAEPYCDPCGGAMAPAACGGATPMITPGPAPAR